MTQSVADAGTLPASVSTETNGLKKRARQRRTMYLAQGASYIFDAAILLLYHFVAVTGIWAAETSGKKAKDFRAKRGFMVRSEGLEPPRCYSLPPQGSASTNSATSAKVSTGQPDRDRINGADVTNRPWGDKAHLRLKSKDSQKPRICEINDLQIRDWPGLFRGLTASPEISAASA